MKTTLIAAIALALMAAAAQAPLNPQTIVAYTDRAIYKPGDTVTITVEALDEELKPAPDISILITVTDPGQETIADNAVKTAADGTAKLTIKLDKQTPEGEYLIEAVDEANVYSPAVAYFIVCAKCLGAEKPPEKTTTVTATLTTTTATTIRQTVTQPPITTTVTEQILTRDTLFIATVAILLAIFTTQLLTVKRLFKQRA